MIMENKQNKKFTFRCMIYREKDETYTAVCLDLDIVEEGHTSSEEARLSIQDAIDSHMQAVAKMGFPKELIFRPAPKEYWDILTKMSIRKLSQPLGALQLVTVDSPSSNLCYA